MFRRVLWESRRQSARGSPDRARRVFGGGQPLVRALTLGPMIGLCCQLWVPGALSQAATPASGAAVPRILPRPTNLQVLPKDISPVQLRQVMTGFRDGLGVTCGYCHAEDPRTQRLDFASDQKPAKQTTRLMIRMLNDINDRYLRGLGDPRYSTPVTCGTCHQGESTPPPFEPR